MNSPAHNLNKQTFETKILRPISLNKSGKSLRMYMSL